MEYGSTGVLEYWSIGVLGYGVLESWSMESGVGSIGVLEYWSNGVWRMEYWCSGL